MLESIGPAIVEGIIELFLKHQIFYIIKNLTNSSRYHHILVGKRRSKRIITIAITYQKEDYYVELLLHNTARTLDKYNVYYIEDESLNVAALERMIKPIYINISHPDLFCIIDDYIAMSLE